MTQLAGSTRALPLRSADVAIIAGAGLGLFTTTAALLIYTFGVFLRPIVAATGWDRTTLASMVGPGVLTLGLLQPAVGWLVDRFGSRRVAGVAMLSTATGLVLLGTVPWSATSFLVCYWVAFVSAGAQTPLPYVSEVARNFRAHRGLALGIATSFTGLGIAFFPWLAARLITQMGWRHAYVGLGVAVLLFLPVVLVLLRPSSPENAAAPATFDDPSTQGLRLREAARTARFWVFALGYFLANLILGSVPIYLPTILGDRGLDPERAAFSMTVMGLTMIGGRVLMGALMDRLFAPWVFAAALLAPVLGTLLLIAGGNSVGIAGLTGGLFGIAVGAEFTVLAYVTSRAFGPRYFGQNYGALAIFLTLGGAAGPSLFTHLSHLNGSYVHALWFSAVMGALAALLFFAIRPGALPFKSA